MLIAGQSRQVRADREHVRQIHLQRIVGLFAEPERRYRARRHRHDVDLFERVLVVLPQQRPDLLRLQVERIVIARTQHVRAEHDAPFDLGTESFVARPGVHRLEPVVAGAMNDIRT